MSWALKVSRTVPMGVSSEMFFTTNTLMSRTTLEPAKDMRRELRERSQPKGARSLDAEAQAASASSESSTVPGTPKRSRRLPVAVLQVSVRDSELRQHRSHGGILSWSQLAGSVDSRGLVVAGEQTDDESRGSIVGAVRDADAEAVAASLRLILEVEALKAE